MKILVTGGAGFIGSNFVRYLLTSVDIGRRISICNLDKLTYAGNLENLVDLESDPRYAFVKGDICNPLDVDRAFDVCDGQVDAVVHFAAESHVDRSIEDPATFLRTNVLGTQVMLDAAKRHCVNKFIQISTDEVYGSLGDDGTFCEISPIAPNSPYAASKASADMLVRAYGKTYGLPVCITRCSNNYGPYQFPEKLIPLMISNALEERPLPVYGDGRNVRDWIHVEDHCSGIFSVIMYGQPGEVYNLGGEAEMTNLDVVKEILEIIGKPEDLIRFVPDRPGHDLRYAMNIDKAKKELGWSPRWSFADGLKATVQWYLDNPGWIDRVRSGAYRDYYQKMYEDRESWVRKVETR
jgi:dTDP-glucose 4,6-dehydratase